MADFTIVPIFWNTTLGLDKQFNDVRIKVELECPECVVILNIPRHHAKKIAQQDWTKDYFISKQKTVHGASRVCTIVYSKYPFTSEEWITPTPSPAQSESPTHITEICVPIGAWKPHRSPIELLQDYPSDVDGYLSYDEVSTITVVASNSAGTASLQQVFDVSKVKNTIAFITNDSVAVDLLWWERLNDGDTVIQLNSALTSTTSTEN